MFRLSIIKTTEQLALKNPQYPEPAQPPDEIYDYF